MAFYVGQKVVCVDDQEVRMLEWDLRYGCVYTIYGIVPSDASYLGPLAPIALMLKEITNPYDIYYGAFSAARFRPVVEKGTDKGVALLKQIADDAARQKEAVV